MGSAPALGRESAKACPHGCQTKPVRVVSAPVYNREKVHADNQYPYVTRRHGVLPGAERLDERGFSIIESKQHEDRVAKMNGLVRE